MRALETYFSNTYNLPRMLLPARNGPLFKTSGRACVTVEIIFQNVLGTSDMLPPSENAPENRPRSTCAYALGTGRASGITSSEFLVGGHEG